jgi:mannose-6-phosphate isomerase class I
LYDENYFELVICGISGILVTLPAITMGAYKHNGFVLPKMTIHGDYAVERKTHQRIVISKEWIDGLGQEFEYKWNFEYFDFKIIGKVEAQKNEVIYLLTNKPHVYRSGRFIETRR